MRMTDDAESVHHVEPRKTAQWARPLLGGLAAGAVLALSFPPYRLPWLLPVGVALLLDALNRCRGDTRRAFYTGAACGAVYFGATLFWLKNIFGPGAVTLIVICLVFPALFGAIHAWLRTRIPALPDWLVAAVAWTAVEVFRSELFVLKFGWMGLGYGVVNSPLVSRLAAVAGSYAVTFVIVLLGAGLLRSAQTRRLRTVAVPVLALIWITCCEIPYPKPATPARPVRVRLVQAEANRLSKMLDLSTRNLPSDTRMIVWPEYSLFSDPTQKPDVWARLTSLPQQTGCYFIFGAKDESGPAADDSFRNTAYVLDPKGEVIGKHVKNHPVHLMKDGIAGHDAKSIQTEAGRIGVAICFDMDFPDVARRLVADGAEVLLVPNNDPAEWGPVQRDQHRAMAQMRAIETGRWVARADVAGGTSVCAPTGHETERVPNGRATVLDVTVGREDGRTLYVRGGWRFSQLVLVLLGAFVVWSWLPARCRSSSPGETPAVSPPAP